MLRVAVKNELTPQEMWKAWPVAARRAPRGRAYGRGAAWGVTNQPINGEPPTGCRAGLTAGFTMGMP